MATVKKIHERFYLIENTVTKDPTDRIAGVKSQKNKNRRRPCRAYRPEETFRPPETVPMVAGILSGRRKTSQRPERNFPAVGNAVRHGGETFRSPEYMPCRQGQFYNASFTRNIMFTYK